MKRHPALHPLSHDHHQGLILAQQLKKDAPRYKGMPSTLEGKKDYAVSFYNTDLIKHFKDEEDVLFPASKGRSEKIDELISEIISEHRQIEKLIDNLQNFDDVEQVMDELGHLLEKHIRKEERELFVMIEEALSEEELETLSDKLKK
jgi:iron-sulfur cluster repair protein YtfE (RIC family)